MTPDQAFVGAVAWLEDHRNQNPDGSWGDGPTRALVTAEALNALARAGRAQAVPAQRAIAWLRNHDYRSLDYRARAIRALETAGVDMSEEALALRSLEPTSVKGWGPSGKAGLTAYDTAMVLGAVEAASAGLGGQAKAVDEVVNRATGFSVSINGSPVDFVVWARDDMLLADVQMDFADGVLNVAMTAEVLRSMVGLTTLSDGTPADVVFDAAQRSMLISIPNVGPNVVFPVGESTSTLEVAQRLSALNLWGDYVAGGLLVELLRDGPGGRFAPAQTGGSGASLYQWSSSDPYVHALGLLALVTFPTYTPPPPSDPDADLDGDGVTNGSDAFPFDPFFGADLDADGVPDRDLVSLDYVDPDLDGDGVPNSVGSDPTAGPDAVHDDPTEWANLDGDPQPDNADPDDDDDGVFDLVELAQGSDPLNADTDGDGYLDGSDECPTRPSGGPVDGDGDGICDGDDACPADPLEVADLDGDLICDGADDDVDGDTWLDVQEVALGTDPRDPASNPILVVLAEPNGDHDGDGLGNLQELNLGLNPLLVDTDADGASDSLELAAGTDPDSAEEQPPPDISVFGAASTADRAIDTSQGVGHTLTGGQPTPVASQVDPGALSQGPGAVNLAGFQPQTTVGRDLDGDGVIGQAEARQRTSSFDVDTDGDRFVDGAGDAVAAADLPGGYDLDGSGGDGFVDGEADFGTDPADDEDHPGKAGDVAPLLHPDGKITAADAAVLLRIVADPAVADDGGSPNEQLTREAADVDGDLEVGADDALRVLRTLGGN